jgi:hypothetical protein
MPKDPWVWGVLIAVAGAVVALAVWLGRGFKWRVGGSSVEVEARREPSNTSVANKAEFEDVKAGDIAGIKTEGGGSLPTTGKIDVLSEGKLKKSEVGDIVGIKSSNNPSQSPATKTGAKSDANRN